MICLLLLINFAVFNDCNAHKFLVFSPATSKSHLISNGRIADELERAGHEVILLELDILGIVDNTESSKLAKKIVVRDLNSSDEYKKIMSGKSGNAMEERSIFKRFKQHIGYQQIYNSLCKDLLSRSDLFHTLKTENFDGFFAEQINLCGFGYAHALGIRRRFLISSCPFFPKVYDFLGLQAPFSYVPFAGDLSSEPTYLERMNSMLHGVAQMVAARFTNYQLTNIFHNEFGFGFPSLLEIIRNVDVTFVATDEIIDFPTVTLSNIVHIGGIGIHPEGSTLDHVFQTEMGKGELGVILFSLGTVVNTTTSDGRLMTSLLTIVSRFPDYHFIIKIDKYDRKTIDNTRGMKNVFSSHWIPQTAILHHPRLRTFITHAGYNGIMEAAHAGVPLITIPFMFDQNQNSRAVEKKGWGIRRHKTQLLTDPNSIEQAIREMLENPKYTKEAHRIRDLIKSKPMGARDRLIKTTEWVIQNGGVHELLADSRNTNVFVYYNLDIVTPVLILVVAIVFYFLQKAGSSLRCFKSKSESSKKKNE